MTFIEAIELIKRTPASVLAETFLPTFIFIVCSIYLIVNAPSA